MSPTNQWFKKSPGIVNTQWAMSFKHVYDSYMPQFVSHHCSDSRLVKFQLNMKHSVIGIWGNQLFSLNPPSAQILQLTLTLTHYTALTLTRYIDDRLTASLWLWLAALLTLTHCITLTLARFITLTLTHSDSYSLHRWLWHRFPKSIQLWLSASLWLATSRSLTHSDSDSLNRSDSDLLTYSDSLHHFDPRLLHRSDCNSLLVSLASDGCWRIDYRCHTDQMTW